MYKSNFSIFASFLSESKKTQNYDPFQVYNRKFDNFSYIQQVCTLLHIYTHHTQHNIHITYPLKFSLVTPQFPFILRLISP